MHLGINFLAPHRKRLDMTDLIQMINLFHISSPLTFFYRAPIKAWLQSHFFTVNNLLHFFLFFLIPQLTQSNTDKSGVFGVVE